MSVEELIKEVNDKYGHNWEPWPDHYEVDIQTYVNVLHAIFERAPVITVLGEKGYTIAISVSSDYKVMFKGMELRIK